MESKLKLCGLVEGIFTDDPSYHPGFLFFDSLVLSNIAASVWKCLCMCVYGLVCVCVCISMCVFVFIFS